LDPDDQSTVQQFQARFNEALLLVGVAHLNARSFGVIE